MRKWLSSFSVASLQNRLRVLNLATFARLLLQRPRRAWAARGLLLVFLSLAPNRLRVLNPGYFREAPVAAASARVDGARPFTTLFCRFAPNRVRVLNLAKIPSADAPIAAASARVDGLAFYYLSVARPKRAWWRCGGFCSSGLSARGRREAFWYFPCVASQNSGEFLSLRM